MAESSTIEWTDATWNPVTGCSIVSPGCTNCYAMRLAGTRLQHHPSRAGLTVDSKAGPVWNGQVRLNEQWLDQPLRWKRPRMIFVCAHGDLFHENVPDEWIDRVFAVMALAPQHTFQVLTKRSERMRAYCDNRGQPAAKRISRLAPEALVQWPLPNVWLGVSAERQQEAGERIPDLLATPAAVRFLSAEPLLGVMDLRRIRYARDLVGYRVDTLDATGARAASGWVGEGEPVDQPFRRLDWVIVGGESGAGARPMHPRWARQLRDQCAAAGVPFFFKQWGEHLGGEGEDSGDAMFFTAASGPRDSRLLRNDDEFGWFDPNEVPDGPMHLRVGKKAAGRLLDGREHNAIPERPA